MSPGAMVGTRSSETSGDNQSSIGSDRRETAVERVLSIDHLAEVCSTAVDPLEIAAHLETAGLSSQVVIASYGHSDVFGLAQTMFDQVPFRTGEPVAPDRPARGSFVDLLRGLLYALPTLLFAAAMAGFTVRSAWWTIPVGLTCGWGLAQATAAVGWTLRGRGETRSDARLAMVSLLVTASASFGLAAIALRLFGGTAENLLSSVGLAIYMTMSGILLLQGAELLLAACLLPGAVGMALSLIGGPLAISARTGSWTVVLSVVLVVLAAHRSVRSRSWRRPFLSLADRRRAFSYLLLGLSCGTMASAVIGFAAAGHPRGDALAIAVWPLLLTLGVMEWQLHSFRGRGATALSLAREFRQFRRAIGRSFFVSFATYVGLLMAFSTIALEVGNSRHATLLPLLLATEAMFGITCFLGMLTQLSARLDVTLIAWTVSLTALAGGLVATLAIYGQVSPVAGLTECLAAAGLGSCTLAMTARRILSRPLSY